MNTLYLLGTSPDLNTLEPEELGGHDTLGINSCVNWADRNNFILTHWMAYDRALRFGHDVKASRGKGRTKWWFHIDHMGHPVMQSLERRGHLVGIYQTKKLPKRMLHTDPLDTEAFSPVIRDLVFTMPTAVCLAAAMGYDDIRIRGMGLGSGRYWNQANGREPERDNYFDAIRKAFEKELLPACERQGIRVRNETPDATFPFAV